MRCLQAWGTHANDIPVPTTGAELELPKRDPVEALDQMFANLGGVLDRFETRMKRQIWMAYGALGVSQVLLCLLERT